MDKPKKPNGTIYRTHGCAYDTVKEIVDFCNENELYLDKVSIEYEDEMYSDDRNAVLEWTEPNLDYEEQFVQYEKDLKEWEANNKELIQAENELRNVQVKVNQLRRKV